MYFYFLRYSSKRMSIRCSSTYFTLHQPLLLLYFLSGLHFSRMIFHCCRNLPPKKEQYNSRKMSFDNPVWIKTSWSSYLESPGTFSGPKSHFKNHDALDVQSFLFQQVLHLNKVYTYKRFELKNFFSFLATDF